MVLGAHLMVTSTASVYSAIYSEEVEHVSAAGLHLTPLSGLDVLQKVVLHSKGKTKVVPAGSHTEDHVVKQLQHGGLGVEERVCGEGGEHTHN